MRGLLLSLILLIPLSASAQQYRGVSAFAAMHPGYPCDALLATTDFSPLPAMAVLYETFGYQTNCIERFTQRYYNKPHLLQIHFSNEVCRRNRNCIDESLGGYSVDKYNEALERMDPDLVTKIRLRMFFLRSLSDAVKNSNTRIIIGAGLEDNYSSKAYENLVSILREQWPWEISRNRHIGGRSLQDAQLEEFHSVNARKGSLPCIANEDGNYEQDKKRSAKFIRHYGACSAVFLWREEHQGRSEGGKRIPPKKRKFVYTAKDVVELGRLLR